MKIYTKTGDQGQTGLFSGTRVSKADLRVEAYGTVDELNSFIGALRDGVEDAEIREDLFYHQHRLFDIGAILADDRADRLLTFSGAATLQTEAAIDAWQAVLPPLKHFILPGGHPQVSQAHQCRTICRRAERRVVALAAEASLPIEVVEYLNRLSDYFFVLARLLAKQYDVEELKWEQGR
ncbi:MAG: cob(I)yrinic acid a,c-diamide adenosyltransferase [Bacteroidota bacterium]